MSKYFRVIIALALVLGVVILAKDNVAWAGQKTDVDSSDPAQDEQSPLLAAPEPGSVKPPPDEVIITETGTYSVGGICTILIEYKVSDLWDDVYLEVPVEKSASVPFPEEDGKIHLPGCHVLHYNMDQLMTEMTADDGSWTICFAAHPTKTTTIFYYLDDLETFVPAWIPIETTIEDGTACAPAFYSGVYAPARK